MGGRLYISRDDGAAALTAAGLRLGIPRQPGVLAAWGQEKGWDWFRPGEILPAGRDGGETVYFCGTVGDPGIVQRALSHILRLAEASRPDWVFVEVKARAPGISSWLQYERACPRLIRLLMEE